MIELFMVHLSPIVTWSIMIEFVILVSVPILQCFPTTEFLTPAFCCTVVPVPITVWNSFFAQVDDILKKICFDSISKSFFFFWTSYRYIHWNIHCRIYEIRFVHMFIGLIWTISGGNISICINVIWMIYK